MPNTRQPGVHHDFADVPDTAACEPFPDDWLVGITDVVNSASAIASGRYKDVNYAGASATAALGNAWGSFDFPFVFLGAAFALHAGEQETATSVWLVLQMQMFT